MYSDHHYLDELLEWTALVCSLRGKPLQNLTTAFINNDPFHCIVDHYFPRTRARFVQLQQAHLPYIKGILRMQKILTEIDGAKIELGNPRDLLDFRVIVTVLALLASRVLLHNDLIEVRKFNDMKMTENAGCKNNSKSISFFCES